MQYLLMQHGARYPPSFANSQPEFYKKLIEFVTEALNKINSEKVSLKIPHLRSLSQESSLAYITIEVLLRSGVNTLFFLI